MKLSSLKNSTKGLIIHHWDTDGLASCALFLNYFQNLNPEIKLEYRPPLINNYFLTDLERTQINKEAFDFILAVDINFPKETIEQLKELTPQFFWFDHHHHQAEPIEVAGQQDASYLSCSHLITDYLGLEDKTLAALGLVGDQEDKVKEHDLVKNYDTLLKAKALIDSNYIIGDYPGIKETIKILQTDPLAVLNDSRLQQNLVNIKTEEDKIVNQQSQTEGQVLIFNLESPYNILSASTRKLAKKYPDKIIINSQTSSAQSNLYVRTKLDSLDLRELIKKYQKQGYSCGGKKEVLGIVLQISELEKIKQEIILWLKNYSS